MANPVTGNKIERVVIRPKYQKDRSDSPVAGLPEIDLTPYVGELYYYETILSPNTTVNISIVNTTANFKIFEDVVIRGGEEVILTVNDVVSSEINDDPNAGLQNLKMYVAQVDSRQANQNAEVFVLKLESAWKETMENINTVTGTVEGNPTQIANKIFSECFNRDIEYQDQATNKTTINFGSEKKDSTFPSIMRIASISENQKSAGFLFWQTKYGHHFKSVDNMINNTSNLPVGKVYEYDYNGINPGFLDTDLSSRTIINLSSRINNYTFKNHQRAAGGVVNFAIDPITYNWFSDPVDDIEQYDFSNFSSETITDLEPTKFNKEGRFENLGMVYRNPADICDLAENPFKTKAPAKARYTSLFGLMVNMTVPVNTSLIAGSVVRLNILRKNEGVECSTEDNIISDDLAGSYIVAAVCHAFDRKKSYSSVMLVRDLEKTK